MQTKSLLKKDLAVGIILLFVGIPIAPTIIGTSSRIRNQEIISGYKNSVLCGFVTDNETNEPIQDAQVRFWVRDGQGNDYDYEVLSNVSGFYVIENVTEGYCLEYGAWADGYHMYTGPDFYIGENVTIWVNISLYPFQPETSQVCGLVHDNYTGEPIVNADIIVHWIDIHRQLNNKGSHTDENGFYSIRIGTGKFSVNTNTEAYIDQGFGWIYINDYETVWVNFSLDPELVVEILKPINGFYYKNKMVFPFYFPVIIGSVDIEINATYFGGNPIDHVEIKIDNSSKYNFTSPPYVYHWDEKTLFRFHHTIEVTVHRNYDSEAVKKLQVWKFF